MMLTQKFTPIAVGETDWRAFDITKDCDGEVPQNPRCVCSWAGPGAGDSSPQSRIITQQLQTSITEYRGPQNTRVTPPGQFLCVYFGGAPSGAAGGAYQLQALFDTPTRSNLSLSALLPCTAT
jgi:hypothetical protein